MIFLFAVVAPPRSGTQWFSRLLTTEHSFCYHELSTHLHPFPSNLALNKWLETHTKDHSFEQAQRRLVLQGYPDYFARHWERALYGQYIVGNSDCSLARMVPGIWSLWPDLRVVFSARHGINCVQSHFGHRAQMPEDLLGQWRRKWQTDDFFTICCHRWTTGMKLWLQARDWLSQRNAAILETRLEKVTGDLAELRRLWDWLAIGQWDHYLERNRQLMRTPINARTNHNTVRTAEDIWHAWTGVQRETFRTLCGPTLSQLGYELPE
jgi:hypothetical protein